MKSVEKNIFNRINTITIVAFLTYMFLTLIDQTSMYLLSVSIQKITKLLRYCCYFIFSIKVLYDLIKRKKNYIKNCFARIIIYFSLFFC